MDSGLLLLRLAQRSNVSSPPPVAAFSVRMETEVLMNRNKFSSIDFPSFNSTNYQKGGRFFQTNAVSFTACRSIDFDQRPKNSFHWGRSSFRTVCSRSFRNSFSRRSLPSSIQFAPLKRQRKPVIEQQVSRVHIWCNLCLRGEVWGK